MRAMHMMAVVSLALLLTGCSFQPDADAMRAEVEEQVAATIEQDASYQTYREQKDIGRLSEENIYQEDADAAEEQGEVHVTFAKNSLLDVQFFADEALTRPFEAECHLSLLPGWRLQLANSSYMRMGVSLMIPYYINCFPMIGLLLLQMMLSFFIQQMRYILRKLQTHI